MIRVTRVAAVLTAVLVAACGTQDDAEQDEPAVPELSAPADAPVSQSSDLQTVSASLNEWSVTLSQDSVAAGPTTFEVNNSGTMQHAFEIEGNGQEWSTDPLDPGGRVSMSLELTAGEYKVYCPIVGVGGNHEQQGMVARLRVY